MQKMAAATPHPHWHHLQRRGKGPGGRRRVRAQLVSVTLEMMIKIKTVTPPGRLPCGHDCSCSHLKGYFKFITSPVSLGTRQGCTRGLGRVRGAVPKRSSGAGVDQESPAGQIGELVRQPHWGAPWGSPKLPCLPVPPLRAAFNPQPHPQIREPERRKGSVIPEPAWHRTTPQSVNTSVSAGGKPNPLPCSL